MKGKTTEDLREILFSTIHDIKHGKIDDRDAQAIAKLANGIVNTANLEVTYAKFINKTNNNEKAFPQPLALTQESEKIQVENKSK